MGKPKPNKLLGWVYKIQTKAIGEGIAPLTAYLFHGALAGEFI